MKTQQSSDLIKVVMGLMDLFLIACAFYLAYLIRFGSFAAIEGFIWLYYFSAPLILLLLLRQGVLTSFRFLSLRTIVESTVVAFCVAGIISSTVLYLTKTTDYSRLLFGSYFLLAATFVLLGKIAIKKLFDIQLRRGRMGILIAMVGFGDKFNQIVTELKEHPQWGTTPTLIIDPRTLEVSQIVRKIRDCIIDEVYISYPWGSAEEYQLDKLFEELEILGLPARVAINFDGLQDYYGQQICTLGTRMGIMLTPHNLDPDQILIKRAMDLAGAVTGLFLLAVMLPFLALAIKLDSKGPVFFSQMRVGKGGREFRIYKFRSMYEDAEERKNDLLVHNYHEGPIFKMENDPRITRFGNFMRKYSLDELPQFWNILKGDMSLVGTRPPTVDEVKSYENRHFRRISIRPGLTGLWQIRGRNSIASFDDVVALDVEYIKSWGIFVDIKIILSTVISLLHRKGRKGM